MIKRLQIPRCHPASSYIGLIHRIHLTLLSLSSISLTYPAESCQAVTYLLTVDSSNALTCRGMTESCNLPTYTTLHYPFLTHQADLSNASYSRRLIRVRSSPLDCGRCVVLRKRSEPHLQPWFWAMVTAKALWRAADRQSMNRGRLRTMRL